RIICTIRRKKTSFVIKYVRIIGVYLGGQRVNTRKIVNFFTKTLIYGGIVGFIASFFVRPGDYLEYLNPFDAFELLGVILFFLGLGLVFTVIAQTGFFAYLFVHRFGENIFKSF